MNKKGTLGSALTGILLTLVIIAVLIGFYTNSFGAVKAAGEKTFDISKYIGKSNDPEYKLVGLDKVPEPVVQEVRTFVQDLFDNAALDGQKVPSGDFYEVALPAINPSQAQAMGNSQLADYSILFEEGTSSGIFVYLFNDKTKQKNIIASKHAAA